MNELNVNPLSCPGTILLVDDNEVIRRAVAAQIERLGHMIETVCNGEEAVNATKSRRYCLIIMDMQMPIMDGPTATRTIRSDAENPCSAVPILAMTSSTMPEERERFIEAGVNEYLVKPVSSSTFNEVLQKWTLFPSNLPCDRADFHGSFH